MRLWRRSSLITFRVFVTNRERTIPIVHGFPRGHLVFSVVILSLPIVAVGIASLALSAVARVGSARARHLNAHVRELSVAATDGVVLGVRLLVVCLLLRRLRVCARG